MTDIASRRAPALTDRYRLEHELGAGGTVTLFLWRRGGARAWIARQVIGVDGGMGSVQARA